MEPLEDTRSEEDFFTVYSKGGGLFDAGFLESIVDHAMCSSGDFKKRNSALSREGRALARVVRLFLSVPNMRPAAELTSG